MTRSGMGKEYQRLKGGGFSRAKKRGNRVERLSIY
jgi:hypothetical protein